MSSTPGNKEGFTLIGVLIFCLILIPVCASLAQASRDFAHGVRDDIDVSKETFLASGVSDVVATGVASDGRLLARLSGKWMTCMLLDYVVAISARDHDGKIDLNNAASELLIVGFEAAGFSQERARLLQQFVEASRSNGETPRELSDVVAKVSLKHAPFEHVDELQDVLAAIDIAPVDLDGLFTVDTGMANLEESTAAPELRTKLRALSNPGAVFDDNRTSAVVDVVLRLKPKQGGKEVALSTTYRKVSAAGDMSVLRSKPLPENTAFPVELPQSDCIRLFALQGGPS